MTNFNSKSTLSKLLLIPLLNGNNIGSISIPSTGDWQTYTTVSNEVSLPAGTHTLRVFAQQPGWNLNWIEFNENEITTTSDCTNPQNIALGKATTQSSTLSNNNSQFGSANAVDGNKNGNHNANSMTHTNNQQNAWWEVDLGEVHDLSVVKLWNRTNCCADRLTDFHVLVSDVPFSSQALNTTINQNGVGDFHFPGTAGRKTDINLNRTGRYVRIQLSGTNALQLAEVEIIGCEPEKIATIYKHCGYNGTSVSLGIGEYLNMPSVGLLNNDISSLRVPAGLQVTLFNNTNFGGSSITFTADDNCLINNSFNDKTGSFIIEPIGAGVRATESNLYVRPIFGQQANLTWYFLQKEEKRVERYIIKHTANVTVEMQAVNIISARDLVGVESYNFIHGTPAVGKNYYQVIVEYEDGTQNYQMIDEIDFEIINSRIPIAPNPAQDILQIDISGFMNQTVRYTVNDLNGTSQLNGIFETTHSAFTEIDLKNIPNGMYVLYLQPQNQRGVAMKFVVAKDY